MRYELFPTPEQSTRWRTKRQRGKSGAIGTMLFLPSVPLDLMSQGSAQERLVTCVRTNAAVTSPLTLTQQWTQRLRV